MSILFAMTAQAAQISAELPCHGCGYDLRAHPQDGKCPECGASVAESLRVAAIPLRPAWRDSDPRWRRRMLAGVWLLVLLPFMGALRAFGLTSSVHVPNIFGYPGAALTLDETLLCNFSVYESLVFCMGVVLLFSKERGRRRNPLDWTRRWGVLCSYVVLLLSAADIFFLGALVSASIGAVFLSIPLKNQPGVTSLLVKVSTAYIRYGAYPHDNAVIVLVAFSSITILLACIPLFDALCSSGPKRAAAILLAPLALFSVINLVQISRFWFGYSSMTPMDVYALHLYFQPHALAGYLSGMPILSLTAVPSLGRLIVEATKWCIVLAIAIWLSIAQLKAWGQGRKLNVA